MWRLLLNFLCWFAAFFRSRTNLGLELVALRQQVGVLKRKNPRPRLSRWDRLLWVVLRRLWSRWAEVLLVVRPETVVGWHRAGFRLYWRFLSRRTSGRPRIASELRELIRRMATENPTWGAPRIHGELLKMGFEVSERTVSRYLPQAGRKRRCRKALVDLSQEPSRSDCGDGLLYRADSNFSRALLLLRDQSRPPPSHWQFDPLPTSFSQRCIFGKGPDQEGMASCR